MQEHGIRSNLPIYTFYPEDDIDIDGFIERRRKMKLEKRMDGDILFSIITPVYNTNIKFLRECADSVRKQTYKKFEWLIIDDGSDEITKKILKKIQKENDFIKLYHFDENRGIATALREGLKICFGDYICFLDSDDLLENNCLEEVYKYLKKKPDIKFLYTNEKNIDIDGTLIQNTKKPDFSMELFYQIMYVNLMKVIHRDVLAEVGYPNPEFGGSWDYDYFLRIAEKFEVGHLRQFIYCWRRPDVRGGFLDNDGRQMIHHQHALRAIRESNERTGLVDGRIVPTEFAWQYRIERRLKRKHEPKVKVLILCKKNPSYLKLLLDSIEREVKYYNFEIVITQHVDEEDEVMTEFLETVRYKVNKCDIEGFNYSEITNWQIKQSIDNNDDYVMILNDDLIFQNDCIHEMVVCMQAKEEDKCGIVGCKLIWPGKNDFSFYAKKYVTWPASLGYIQHAGVDLYSDNCCAHRYYGFATHWMAANYLRKTNAVTFACVMIKAEILRKLKFDLELPVDYQDIDMCIEAKKIGWSTYYTPWAVALHFESVTKQRGKRNDFEYFEIKHEDLLRRFPTQEQSLHLQSQGL